MVDHASYKKVGKDPPCVRALESTSLFWDCQAELNPVEECWNLLKDELDANRLYCTFEEMKRAICKRMRTKRFKLNVINYSC